MDTLSLTGGVAGVGAAPPPLTLDLFSGSVTVIHLPQVFFLHLVTMVPVASALTFIASLWHALHRISIWAVKPACVCPLTMIVPLLLYQVLRQRGAEG